MVLRVIGTETNTPSVRKWIGQNLTEWAEGRSMPVQLIIHQLVPDKAALDLPHKIRGLAGHVANANFGFSGIYFLCRGDAVVYVGQSGNPGARIEQHTSDKEFDVAYVLPIPPPALNEVERAFIRIIQPKYNNAAVAPAKPTDNKLIQKAINGVCADDVITDGERGRECEESKKS